MFLVLVFGIVLWLFYGVLSGEHGKRIAHLDALESFVHTGFKEERRAETERGAKAHGSVRRDLGIHRSARTVFAGEADVRFMQGMIAHHAQAIYMSRLASGHEASPHLAKFAAKIDQSQQAEIKLMQEILPPLRLACGSAAGHARLGV